MEMERKRKISGSVLAKIAAFFVLTISAGGVVVALLVSLMLFDTDAYAYQSIENSVQAVAREMMVSDAWNQMVEMRNLVDSLYKSQSEEDIELYTGLLQETYHEDRNFTVEFYVGDELYWGNYTGYETPYSFRYTYSEWIDLPVEQTEDGGETTGQPGGDEKDIYTVPEDESGVIQLEKGENTGVLSAESEAAGEITAVDPVTEPVLKTFTCRLYVNPEFPADDGYRQTYNMAYSLCQGRYVYPVAAVIGLVIALISFLFLMCSAGHRNGREGIVPSVLAGIHFDILTVFFGAAAIWGASILLKICAIAAFGDIWYVFLAAAGALGGALSVWCTIYCMEFAIRLKMGILWQHTLIAAAFRVLVKVFKALWRGTRALISGFPLVVNAAVVYLAICMGEFLGLCIWCRHIELFVIWFLEKLVLFALIMYLALICRKLQAGSRALAEGNLGFQLDTSLMVLDFKEHGENLNRIGQGISKAVEARMKSERLKTELITNVSHDLKTPLTSIINYADLLSDEVLKEGQTQNAVIAEYTEVLLRQSKRLKKLLEDLLEASKATTGALEVNLEQCEISVMLSQAASEYEQRFAEKQLNLLVRQPEEPVMIMADGRHLWRVFDNLLNNIYKYAQENTRVYLNVESKAGQVEIIFRNMSKYALDISGEELEERFVRGDKSRHMEGNGLGLSIAKSLVELQKGSLEVVTDGDLFKVTLSFPTL